MRACAAVFLAALIAAGAGPARADDPATEQARQYYESGTRHYDLGHWDEAIAEYEKAYELRPDPSFLYNLAQVYRRKGDARRALDLYKNYLRKVPKSPQREEVEEKIAALQKQLDETSAKPTTATSEPGAPASLPATAIGGASTGEPVLEPGPTAPPPLPNAQSAAPVSTLPIAVQPSPSPSPGRSLRLAGIITGSVGAGALIAGAVYGLRARSLSNKVQGASSFNRSDDSSGQRAETLQWTFYGIGAGAVVAGGVLYYLGWRSSHTTPSMVSVGPVVGPGTAGLSAMGVF